MQFGIKSRVEIYNKVVSYRPTTQQQCKFYQRTNGIIQGLIAIHYINAIISYEYVNQHNT